MQKNDHLYRINQVLSIIHSDIAGDLQAKTLAAQAAFSEQYFHRLFKKVTGVSLHQYIRRIRLEAAANQLMFSPQLTVAQVAETCGFASLSSFSRAFKSIYGTTPGDWRSGVAYHQQHYFLSDPDIKSAYERLADKSLPAPQITELEPQQIAYIRHTGYGRGISETWNTLRTWAMGESRSVAQQIGLYHSNPALVPLAQCRYVACVCIDKPVIHRGKVNSAVIPGGLHAMFSIRGRYGELLPHISKILEEWLPDSGFAAKTTPAFARYRKNQFLSDDDFFDLDFYLPIVVV